MVRLIAILCLISVSGLAEAQSVKKVASVEGVSEDAKATPLYASQC